MTAAALILAHQGGWDEVLLILTPIAIFAALLGLANRRANVEVRRRADGDGATDDGDGATDDEGGAADGEGATVDDEERAAVTEDDGPAAPAPDRAPTERSPDDEH